MDNIKIFPEGSAIKENLHIDEEGNRVVCMEVGSMKHCTTFRKRKDKILTNNVEINEKNK